MTDRDPGRHTRRAARQAAQNRPQLAVQLTTLSVGSSTPRWAT